MNKCYKCDTDLIPKINSSIEAVHLKKYSSKEHIIPNFCGGHLTSDNLLCKGCNEELGTELEGHLSKKLLFHELFHFKLDRGKQENGFIEAYTSESRTKVLVNKDLFWRRTGKPHEIQNGKLEIRASTKKEVKNILVGLARKNPKINVEEFLKSATESESHLEERVDFNDRTIGGKKVHRAITKIAVNFYLHKYRRRELIEDPIDYVCNSNVTNHYTTFYSSLTPLYELKEDEITHILFLRGDKKKKLLYCYVELFSVVSFIVMLNRDYDEENFSETYCYNVLKNEIIEKEVNLILFRDIFATLNNKDFFEKHLLDTEEFFSVRATRIIQIWDKLNHAVQPPLFQV